MGELRSPNMAGRPEGARPGGESPARADGSPSPGRAAAVPGSTGFAVSSTGLAGSSTGSPAELPAGHPPAPPPARGTMAAALAEAEAGLGVGGKPTGRPMISMRPDLSISEEMEDNTALAGAPRTSLVLVLLVLAAGLISFLGAYAVSDVLADADVIARWTPGADPRPRWMATGFVILLGAFAAIAAVAKVASQSQLRRIDQMAD